jgi:hypothetical protein
MTIRALAAVTAIAALVASRSVAADLTAEERGTALTELIRVIEAEYPIEETARSTAAALRQRRAAYESFTSGPELAERLT